MTFRYNYCHLPRCECVCPLLTAIRCARLQHFQHPTSSVVAPPKPAHDATVCGICLALDPYLVLGLHKPRRPPFCWLPSLLLPEAHAQRAYFQAFQAVATSPALLGEQWVRHSWYPPPCCNDGACPCFLCPCCNQQML